MPPYRTPEQAYHTGRTIGAAPIETIVMAYGEALAGCHVRDRRRAGRAVAALRNSLDLDAFPSLSARLGNVYDHCLYLIINGQFEESAVLLGQIRDAWRDADPRPRP